jgi:hypothetical protein
MLLQHHIAFRIGCGGRRSSLPPQSARVRVRAPMVADRLAHIDVSSLTSSSVACCVVGVARMNTSLSSRSQLHIHAMPLSVSLAPRLSQLSQTRDADAARAAREERAFLRLKQSAARTIQRYWRGELMSTYMMIARQAVSKIVPAHP